MHGADLPGERLVAEILKASPAGRKLAEAALDSDWFIVPRKRPGLGDETYPCKPAILLYCQCECVTQAPRIWVKLLRGNDGRVHCTMQLRIAVRGPQR